MERERGTLAGRTEDALRMARLNWRRMIIANPSAAMSDKLGNKSKLIINFFECSQSLK